MHKVERTLQPGSNTLVHEEILFNERALEVGVTKKVQPILEPEDLVASRNASFCRTERGLRDDQEMFVGLAFTTSAEILQFRLFHTVMHIDATANTNKEERPLVTVASKDSTGKMFMVLRCFMSNEQAWAYKWLFQVVFPALLGEEYVSDVSMILTNGDNQEIIQLEAAIDLCFGRNMDDTPKVKVFLAYHRSRVV